MPHDSKGITQFHLPLTHEPCLPFQSPATESGSTSQKKIPTCYWLCDAMQGRRLGPLLVWRRVDERILWSLLHGRAHETLPFSQPLRGTEPISLWAVSITRTWLRYISYVQVFAIANPTVICHSVCRLKRSCALFRGLELLSIFPCHFVP